MSSLREQIRDRMNLKETEELLEIWQDNHHFEWSEDAFEVIKEILKERGVDIPEQNEPVHGEPVEGEASDDNGLDAWEAKLLDDENQPEFYDTLEVITLKDNINKVAKAAIVVYVLQSVPTFQLCDSQRWFQLLKGKIVQIREGS